MVEDNARVIDLCSVGFCMESATREVRTIAPGWRGRWVKCCDACGDKIERSPGIESRPLQGSSNV